MKLGNKSLKLRYAAKNAVRAPAAKHLYQIVDPHFRADIRGHFAGVPVERRGAGQVVTALTEKQAKFYLAQGSIKRIETQH